MTSKREVTVTSFDGAIVAPGIPMRGRDTAIAAALDLWADSVADQGEWSDHEYLRGMVEVLAHTFGSPFQDEVDWDTVKEWYAYKIGGYVK